MLSATSSHTAGAPGAMASSECVTKGSSSYSTSTASAASSACASVSATTMATASPTWRALSAGSSTCGPMKISPPPGPVSFMSYLVFGTGSCGIGPRRSPRQSAPVKIPRTPGSVCARVLSMRTIRACGYGERTMTACSSPGSEKSSLKRPLPVTRRSSSLRGTGFPIVRKEGSFIAIVSTRSVLSRYSLSGAGWEQYGGECMARVENLDPADLTPDQQRIARDIASVRSRVGGPFAIWLRTPAIADAANRLGTTLRHHSNVDRRLFELMVLIIARHWGAQYEWYV